MIDKVKRYVEKYEMLQPEDIVVAGVSGGADSLCLLFLMHEFAKAMPLQIAVVHVNHGIREDAGEDAAYVEKLCGELGIPFFLKEVRIEEIAKREGISTEEAGREVRYRAFEETLNKLTGGKGGKIAVAHTANDRAETMLFHLFRGTGVTGLAGIKPVRDNIIRPLLCLEREETENYLKERGIFFCIDSTNNEDTYTRNKIRHHILPYAKKNLCDKSICHMNTTAEMLLETEDFLRQQTALAYEKTVKETENGFEIKAEDFLAQPPILQKRLLLVCMEKRKAGRRDIGAVHIEDMLTLFYHKANRELTLPYGISARREYDRIFLQQEKEGHENRKKDRKENIQTEIKVPSCGEIKIEGTGVFEFRIFEYDKSENIPEKTYTKWFDYDKIVKSLVLRTRKQGDYLTINRTLSKQSLKKYFIQEKIPKSTRDSLFVLADGNHILWVPGYRISQFYKVEPETRNILQVHLRGGQC